mgnify:FL=1
MPDAPVTDEALVEEIAVALLRARHPRYDHEPDLLWEHWQWFIAGRGNPDSCVHTSTIGEAVRDATAVLAHLRERGMLVPDGWVAVPKEPTEAMRMTRLPGGTKIATVLRDFNRLRRAIQSHDPEATEAAWLDCERWLQAIFGMAWRADEPPHD